MSVLLPSLLTGQWELALSGGTPKEIGTALRMNGCCMNEHHTANPHQSKASIFLAMLQFCGTGDHPVPSPARIPASWHSGCHVCGDFLHLGDIFSPFTPSSDCKIMVMLVKEGEGLISLDISILFFLINIHGNMDEWWAVVRATYALHFFAKSGSETSPAAEPRNETDGWPSFTLLRLSGGSLIDSCYSLCVFSVLRSMDLKGNHKLA